MKLFIKILLISLLITVSGLKAQFNETEQSTRAFFVDVICFKSSSNDSGRVDVYVIVPYQTLNFIKTDELFGASYDLNIKITDSSGKKITSKYIEKRVIAKDYFISQGGTAATDNNQAIFILPAGKYNVDVILTDSYSRKSYQRSRSTTVLNFSAYNFSISGIMFVSSIEENRGKYTMTPHISDNISGLKDGFFIFFESYNKSGLDSADFHYIISDSKENEIEKSEPVRRYVKENTTQHFIKVNYPKDRLPGNYIIRLIASKPSPTGNINTADYLAVAERSIGLTKTFTGSIYQDLNKSVKQLRYVASQSELNYIDEAQSYEEKLMRFDDFWKKLDPSPNTERNEAFDEYYARIEYANKNFKSYMDGWRTDKGMVYVIYGKPASIERRTQYNDGRVYEYWTYAGGRTIIFIDYSGFNEFRLYSPPTINDKYVYSFN